MRNEINQIVIFDLPDEGVDMLVAECKSLIANLSGRYGISSLVTTQLNPDGNKQFPEVLKILRTYVQSKSPFDPTSAPQALPWPLFYLVYTGPIKYTQSDIYVYGSGNLQHAFLRVQHRKAVWHETCHAFGASNCQGMCLMNWHVPTTDLCSDSVAEIRLVLDERAQFLEKLQRNDVHDLKALKYYYAKREDSYLEKILKQLTQKPPPNGESGSGK